MGLTPPHVRVLSWLGACTFAALVALALRHALPASLQEAADAPIAYVTIVQPRPPAPAREPRIIDDVGQTARVVSTASASAELTLWTYGAHGEIVFADLEQLERCAEARRGHREASDCPGADETAALTLGDNARRGIRIDPPRYRSRS